MKWFSVSFISTIICTSSQNEYPVFEDIILIGADSEAELQGKIKVQGELINKAGAEGITYNNEAAKQIFLGVRKIRAIYNTGGDSLNNAPPDDGCELTHSFYIVPSFSDAEKIASGNAVEVRYVDDSEI